MQRWGAAVTPPGAPRTAGLAGREWVAAGETHTSCVYQHPHPSTAEGRPVTSPSPLASAAKPGGGRSTQARTLSAESPGRWVGTRMPGHGTQPWPAPACLGGAGGVRGPRTGYDTQRQPLTLSSVQAEAPRLTLPAAGDRAAVSSSSRWRVPMTSLSPPPAISARLCGRRFPGRPAVTSPGTRVRRLPPSPPLGRLCPPPHRLRSPPVAWRRLQLPPSSPRL
jgi:hypothetical protein